MNKFEHILNDPEVITLLDIFEEKLFLVGGCVRDAILDKKTSDIDFATKLKPNEVLTKMSKQLSENGPIDRWKTVPKRII